LILMPRGKGADEPWEYIYLASLIRQHIGELFPGLILNAVHAFRVTRNSDLYIDEELSYAVSVYAEVMKQKIAMPAPALWQWNACHDRARRINPEDPYVYNAIGANPARCGSATLGQVSQTNGPNSSTPFGSPRAARSPRVMQGSIRINF